MSKIEQVAEHLRQEMMRGKWRREIPGREELASELGVNSKTVEAALRLLELKGILIPQGTGRRRKIANLSSSAPPALQIKIMLYEQSDRSEGYYVETFHQLTALGHVATFAGKSLHDLGMDVKRVASYVKNNPADAWVVVGGSREILEWFAAQKSPVFAQFGRCREIPIAGVRVSKITAHSEAISKLVSLGHRRIVMLARTERRKPNPGMLEQAFLDELEKNGITTGNYHLPDWKDNIAGFHRCLDSLFGATPPTALLISEASHFIAAQQHLVRMGIVIPRDVSLICQDPNVVFSWCVPEISHINWDSEPVVKSILNWANRVARGNDKRKQNVILADFVEGGTIGPAP